MPKFNHSVLRFLRYVVYAMFMAIAFSEYVQAESYKFLLKWGSEGSWNGQFRAPHGVTVDSSGNIYVADTYNHRIQKFDSGGNFITKWGSYGSGDSQFVYPSAVAADQSGNIYVADANNNRIQKFDSIGNFITKWGSEGVGDAQFSLPQGAAVDLSGNIYVADANNNRIQKFDSIGNFITKWGSWGQENGQFKAPQGAAVDSSGNLYIAEYGNHRIQKFGLVCTPPPPGLISWWDAEGDANDLIGINHGTLVNQATFATGKVGQAFNLDGVDDYVEIPSGAFDFGSAPFSIGFWMKSNNGGSNTYLIGKSHPSEEKGFDIRLNNSMIQVMGVNDWTVNITSDAPIAISTWHHIVLSLTDTKADLYIDAVLKGSSARSAISATADLFRIGYTTNFEGETFNGLIDEVQIYNLALTSEQVAAIYNAGSAGVCTSQYTLTITKAGTGTGTVSAGANCTLTWVGSTGTCTVNGGKAIILSGSASAGSIFTGWSGGTYSASSCTGTGGCTFYITANSGVTGTFNSLIPLPPQSLTAKATSSSTIVLGWKDKSTIETSFNIERKIGDCGTGDIWSLIKTVPANTIKYTNTSLSANTAYSYRVRANNTHGYSDYTNCASANTGSTGTPISPDNLKAESISVNQIKLTWKDKSTNETGFKIYRKVGAAARTFFATKSANSVSHIDTTAGGNTSATTYSYDVQACNAVGCSPSTTLAVVPYKPTNLTAVKALSSQIDLTWTDVSTNETSFQIQRKSGNCASANAWRLIATKPANSISHSDKAALSGKYSYRINAVTKSAAMPYAFGYSLWSECKSAITP